LEFSTTLATAMTPTKIAVVGAGWRSDFYLRLARLMPEQFELVGWVVRNAQQRGKYQVPTYFSVGDLLEHEKPHYVVSAVSWASNPEILKDLVGARIPVLSETPPASDSQALRKLWAGIGSQDLVQVAEQYMRLPMHAARLAVTQRGEIGDITSVQVSSTHGYHAVSMMRTFLGADFGPAEIRATSFTAPLIDPLARDAWSEDLTPKPAKTVLATIDFQEGKSGLYDFTDNQWHNQLRHRRIVIRGGKGEIVDNDLIRLVSPKAITTSTFNRYQLGHDLNLDGHDTEHISFDGKVIYQNPFLGLRLMDEEIAIATMMVEMSDWVNGASAAPYPLAQACQDHLISLAIDESLEKGIAITTGVEAWS
jgi:predicted dehydrogenase